MTHGTSLDLCVKYPLLGSMIRPPSVLHLDSSQEGGVYRQDNRGMKLVYAYGIINDGEAFLGIHRDTTLLGFIPGS
jgi:hypothetical protein